MDETRTKLEKIAKEHGVQVKWRDGFHVQLVGKLLVNYYPTSAKRTAYVAGTIGGKHNVSLLQAVKMALTPPPPVPKFQRAERRYNSRKLRKRMLKGRTECKCHWCPTMIDLDTSTVDHVIPLRNGGLDHGNNRVLACKPCNERRGHDMPELRD